MLRVHFADEATAPILAASNRSGHELVLVHHRLDDHLDALSADAGGVDPADLPVHAVVLLWLYYPLGHRRAAFFSIPVIDVSYQQSSLDLSLKFRCRDTLLRH